MLTEPRLSCRAAGAAVMLHLVTPHGVLAHTVPIPEIAASGSAETTDSGAPALSANVPNVEQISAASEKIVTREEVLAIPVSRPGEVLEVVPGLVITQHSGEGKANQYFLRGFNLDHGTDLAIWIDGMPVNMRTHGHGQGYADINFLIPELIQFVQIRKGPYFADEGDFSSAGAVHIDLVNRLNKNLVEGTVGSFGYRRGLGIGNQKVGNGNLLVAAEAVNYNGPWDVPDKVRKLNGVMRYAEGDRDNGLTITGMAYHNHWNSTDQVALRAIDTGIIGRFGTLNSTDGGKSSRYSMSGPVAGEDLDLARRPTAPSRGCSTRRTSAAG